MFLYRSDENGCGRNPIFYSFGNRIVQQGYEDDHRSPSRAMITNECSDVSTLPYAVIQFKGINLPLSVEYFLTGFILICKI